MDDKYKEIVMAVLQVERLAMKYEAAADEVERMKIAAEFAQAERRYKALIGPLL